MYFSPLADNSLAHPLRNNIVNRSKWLTSLISPDVSCRQLQVAAGHRMLFHFLFFYINFFLYLFQGANVPAVKKYPET